MRVLPTIKKTIKNPIYIFSLPRIFPFINLIPDEVYLKLRYKAKLGRYPDLRNPKLFTEKMQWLKLHDRCPEYVRFVDKYEARKIISEKCGAKYLIPLLGVWDSADDIDFSKLPDQFVLKCTHDSGGIVICRDKNTFDIKAAKQRLTKLLKYNYFWHSREYPYKKVKPRIICEKYMTDESVTELKDYKVSCFNGEPKFIQLDYDRYTSHKRNMYDTEWNPLSFSVNAFYADALRTFKRPSALDEMLDISREMSKGYPFLRVDFYVVNETLYLGELTLYPASGMGIITPPEYEGILGELLDISGMHRDF